MTLNGVEYDDYVWTCPFCNVAYINSTYCASCKFNGRTKEFEQDEEED